MKDNDPTPPVSPNDSWQTKQVLETAKNDLQSHLTDVKDAARQTVQEVRAAASVTATAARDGYQALREDASSHLVSYRGELEHFIREEPLKSLGAAALAGVILGLLARR